MKIALGIEYCGYQYYGWQRQAIPNTVQEHVEKALSAVAAEQINITCAGRTDTGVHALQQVIHFDTAVERELHAWVLGANTKLPADIAVTWAKQVSDDFHARFSALNRTYQYLILNRRARPAIFNGRVTWECRSLDVERMRLAATRLQGKHDFTSFRAAACQAKSPVRTVHSLEIHRLENWFLLTICANAFLHHMVRNIAGVLMMIGSGKQEVSWCEEVLLAKDRTAGGVTAPPDGLYLVNVEYPEQYAIPRVSTLYEQLGLNL